MQNIILGVLVWIGLAFTAQAQTFFANTQVKTVTTYHTTVGTSTAAAISSVGGGLLSWKICNDAVNTSTYLLVGKAVDAATDGVMLGKGSCFECPMCLAGSLSSINVKAQAGSNGYSVIQYRN